jgi:transcriptional regulator with XRE-family HTH domain
MSAAQVIRAARRSAGLTQADLARRMGTSQAAVAQLERVSSNPTVATVEAALRVTDHQLELSAVPARSNVDESLIAEMLRLTPAQRLASFQSAYDSARRTALAGARARGELA